MGGSGQPDPLGPTPRQDDIKKDTTPSDLLFQSDKVELSTYFQVNQTGPPGGLRLKARDFLHSDTLINVLGIGGQIFITPARQVHHDYFFGPGF